MLLFILSHPDQQQLKGVASLNVYILTTAKSSAPTTYKWSVPTWVLNFYTPNPMRLTAKEKSKDSSALFKPILKACRQSPIQTKVSMPSTMHFGNGLNKNIINAPITASKDNLRRIAFKNSPLISVCPKMKKNSKPSSSLKLNEKCAKTLPSNSVANFLKPRLPYEANR